MIDTHCHLTFPDFKDKTQAVLDEAAAHGVSGCISISTNTSDCLEVLALAEHYERVWCTSGVHPLYSDREMVWENILKVIAHPKCVAWGELGLDNFHKKPLKDVQHTVLAQQLEVMKTARSQGINKPIVIHCREAFAELMPILKSQPFDPGSYVFHCFTGSTADMRSLLDFGACVSFTGVLTYSSAAEVREAAKLVPLDRLMVETDAPYLSPEPKRTTRPCAPYMTSYTAQKLAEVRGIPFSQFHEILNANTKRFFGIDAR